MRKIRLVTSVAFALLIGASAVATAAAQAPPGAPLGDRARLERRLERMKERLELTDDQVARVRPILRRLHAERHRIRELPRAERRDARATLVREARAEFARVLTPAQLTELEERFRRFREGRRHGRQHRHDQR